MLIISSVDKFLLKFPIMCFICSLQSSIKENYITIILYFLDNVLGQMFTLRIHLTPNANENIIILIHE